MILLSQLRFLVFSVYFIGFASAINKMHEQMNIEELRNTFQVESHKEVPEYEVINFHTISKRETTENNLKTKQFEKLLKLKAFGQNYELSMQPVDEHLFNRNFKMWSAESDGNGTISYTELPDVYVGDLYQDEKNQAALLFYEDKTNNSQLAEGTISNDLVIKPLPLHISKRLIESNKKIPDNELSDLGERDKANEVNPRHDESSVTVHPHHVVYRRYSSDYEDMKSNAYAYMEDEESNNTSQNSIEEGVKRSIVKRQQSNTVYPEILVVLDHSTYKLHGSDEARLKRYFLAFWSGVDLRYRTISGPTVKLSVSGFIIAKNPNVTPYMERNRIGRNVVDTDRALPEMGRHFFKNKPTPVYDMAVAITKLDMCGRNYANAVCNTGVAGFAFIGGACKVDRWTQMAQNVAILEDSGGFSGIVVAAHEVGHLLGVVHDGDPAPPFLGGPGATRCRWEDGYIMSDLRYTERGVRWSPCSIQCMRHFLNSRAAWCLKNVPQTTLSNILPGKLMSLDEQCKQDTGGKACFRDATVCTRLYCYYPAREGCLSYRPAAEGSSCGNNQICRNGVCVPDALHSWNVPSYMENHNETIHCIQSNNTSYKN